MLAVSVCLCVNASVCDASFAMQVLTNTENLAHFSNANVQSHWHRIQNGEQAAQCGVGGGKIYLASKCQRTEAGEARERKMATQVSCIFFLFFWRASSYAHKHICNVFHRQIKTSSLYIHTLKNS